MRKREEDSLLGKNTSNAGVIVPREAEVEKTAFLAKPVRLTPAWEANNLPNDELNFRGMTMDRVTLELNPPRDRLNLIYFAILLHGIGTLMPWNMFITAREYFVDYKLDEQYTGVKSEYGKYFFSYLGLAAQVPNVIFNWANIFIDMGGNLTPRIVWSLIIQVIVFIFTVILAMVDSSGWPELFFWLTMGSVVILNTACGIFQNSVYGMAAKLSFKYTGAVVLGSNISGTLTVLISIFSTQFSSSIRTAAIYYFIGAMFVLLACFDTYFALPLNRFYRYNEILHEKVKERSRHLGTSVSEKPPYKQILKQAFPQLFNVFFIFLVTLNLFPAIQADIKISDVEHFPIGETLYGSILCYLTFNMFAMLGSLTTSWIRWPKKEYLVWPVLLRAIFVPLLIFCNYQPKDTIRLLPVYIKNDWVYWAVGSLMAYSSGYLSSLAMMYAPQTVSSKYASTAGMFAAACLITGIFTGITSSAVYPAIVRSPLAANITTEIENKLLSLF